VQLWLPQTALRCCIASGAHLGRWERARCVSIPPRLGAPEPAAPSRNALCTPNPDRRQGVFEPIAEELRRGGEGGALQDLDSAALAASLFDLGERPHVASCLVRFPAPPASARPQRPPAAAGQEATICAHTPCATSQLKPSSQLTWQGLSARCAPTPGPAG
jgi:hypothetical protein